MKKIILTAAVAALLFITAACGQSGAPAAGFSREDLYLNINEKQYHLGSDIETVISELGKNYEYSEGRSCDYDGLDKTYIYELAEFYTWPLPEGDMINEIYTTNPAVTTSKGISVGAKKEDVLAAYGSESEDTGFQLLYKLPESADAAHGAALCFDLENDVVTAIYITNQPV